MYLLFLLVVNSLAYLYVLSILAMGLNSEHFTHHGLVSAILPLQLIIWINEIELQNKKGYTTRI